MVIAEILDHKSSVFCQYFGRCGGCRLQHLSADEYKTHKLQQFTYADLIELENPKRRKITLQFVQKKLGIILGLFAPSSNKIVNIKSCPICSDEISALIPIISEFLDKNLIEKESGQIFITKASNGIAAKIFLETKRSTIEIMNLSRKVRILSKNSSILSIKFYANNNLVSTHQQEEPYVEFAGQVKVKVEADSFLQATIESDKVISHFVLTSLASIPKNTPILDLFCGRGTISIALSCAGRRVDAVDFDISALTSLKQATKDYPINIWQQDLIFAPISADKLKEYKCIILNPPRKGANNQIEEIIKSVKNAGKLEKILYISCYKDSFNEDVKLLEKSGFFKIINLKILDQFKWTEHVEILSEISRI
ncbi:MAG: methyltransferase [Rickettsiaceae bacterium]|nr:methyltransferase [Rickettsiaceae bacterium]